MYPVIDAVPAASSPATENANPLRQQLNALDSSARDHFRKTGELPESLTTPADSSPATETQAQSADPPSDENAENTSDSAPGGEPQEPTKDQKQSNRDWRKEVLKVKDEQIELLKSQLAESRKSAPAAPKVEAPKPSTAESSELPDLDDYLAQGKTAKQWQADYGKEAIKLAVKQAEALIDSRFAREQTSAQAAEKSKLWTASKEAATKKYKDFEAVADRAPVNPVLVEALRGHAQPAEILYFLGNPANAEEAKRIFADTDIDGLDHETLKKAQSNPAISARTNTALGIARAEFNAIARSLLKAPSKEKTVDSVSGGPRPSSEVTVPGKGVPVGNSIEDAIKRGDTRAYRELMNAEDRKAINR